MNGLRGGLKAAALVSVSMISLVAHAQLPTGWVEETSCISCHKEIVDAYQQSAHARTSARPTDASVKGNFSVGQNTFLTANPNVSFRMEKIGDAFFQKAIVVTPTQTLERRERLDLVIGSGRKGQTYLYWAGDQLFELPVSCWTKTGEWMNSPGYPDGTAHFDRGASERCLECHASAFVSRPPPRNRFDPASVVPGIACQKCHGPAADHVRDKLAVPVASAPLHGTRPVNPAHLTRARQMDLCSLCHAGVGRALAPPLSYSAGDTLAKFLEITPAAAHQPIDPHGSQVQTLTQSACYQKSPTLTCVTCHNVHRVQRRTEDYATMCAACHRAESCGEFARQGEAIQTRCIDCHMPLETTAKIVMRTASGRHQPEVRNHRIGIYPGP